MKLSKMPVPAQKPAAHSLPQMTSPIPNSRIRGRDGWGSGSFGASRDHGRRHHKGVDIVAKPGQAVVSPVDGTVVRTNVRPYANDPSYYGIELETADGYRIKMFYLTPAVRVGTKVRAGEPIGTAQDISLKYPDRGSGPMTPHVHVEVRKDGRILDPTDGVTGKHTGGAAESGG